MIKEDTLLRLRKKIESMQLQIKEIKNSKGFMGMFYGNQDK